MIKIQCLRCGQIVDFPAKYNEMWWRGVCHKCDDDYCIWENVDEVIDDKDYLSLYAVRRKFVNL